MIVYFISDSFIFSYIEHETPKNRPKLKKPKRRVGGKRKRIQAKKKPNTKKPRKA